jgi:large subunit ribosomal protein L32
MTPKQRHTKSRKRIRRSAINLAKATVATCPKCKKPVRPHAVCEFCGNYDGKEVKKISHKELKKAEIKKTTDKKSETKASKDKKESKDSKKKEVKKAEAGSQDKSAKKTAKK